MIYNKLEDINTKWADLFAKKDYTTAQHLAEHYIYNKYSNLVFNTFKCIKHVKALRKKTENWKLRGLWTFSYINVIKQPIKIYNEYQHSTVILNIKL